jgi:hypothetical protein
MKCNSRKINRPTKNMTENCDTYISKLFLTKMQVKFSIFFHHGSLNVIGGYIPIHLFFIMDSPWTMKYYFYTFKNPTGRRASVREFITRQTCTICDYTVDYMCRTKTSKSPHAHNCNCGFPWFNLSLLIICCLWQLPLCVGYTRITSLIIGKNWKCTVR